MATVNGNIIWYERIARDVPAMADFYSTVVGWSVAQMPTEGATFTIFQAGSASVAALIPASDSADEPAGWLVYVGVDDMETTIARAVALGGAIRQTAVHTSGIGTFAIVADPQGADIGLFAPAPDNDGRSPHEAGVSGHVGWHELYTSDPDAAFAFYSELFGWKQDQVFDMGPAGPYRVFSTEGRPMGGMMRTNAVGPACTWSPFVQIDAIETAAQRVQDAGGTVIDGLREVPDGAFTVKCIDTEGTMFALTGRKSDAAGQGARRSPKRHRRMSVNDRSVDG